MAEFHRLRSNASIESGCSCWDEWNRQAVDLAASEPRAPLPCLDHLTYRDYDEVYEPSDDTYLLLDAIQYELKRLRSSIRSRSKVNLLSSSTNGTSSPTGSSFKEEDIWTSTPAFICVEIGCGTGVASVLFRTQWMSSNEETSHIPLLSYVTDINPKALKVAVQTFQHAASQQPDVMSSEETHVRAVQCDLVSALVPELDQSVHFVLFNPPYVPTPDTEVYSERTGTDGANDETFEPNVIQASWAGGRHGRRVVDRALTSIARILQRPHGVAYLVTVDENRPWELADALQLMGLCMRPLFRRQAHNEFLTIQKLSWIDEGDHASNFAHCCQAP